MDVCSQIERPLHNQHDLIRSALNAAVLWLLALDQCAKAGLAAIRDNLDFEP